MDPVSLVVGAGIAGVAFVLGRIGRRRVRQEPQQVEPVCSCGHSLAYHDPESRACHGKVETPVEFDKVYGAVGFAMEACTCHQYVGPQPLETFYAPEITE